MKSLVSKRFATRNPISSLYGNLSSPTIILMRYTFYFRAQ